MKAMYKSTLKITKMDCASEEHLIRMKLEPEKQIRRLEFDIQNRKLYVFHTDQADPILKDIQQLGLHETLLDNIPVDTAGLQADQQERKLFWWVLAINFAFFSIEMTAGLFSESMGLVADSLDMLADAIVYGLSLMAVGATFIRKKKVARLSGYFQMSLA